MIPVYDIEMAIWATAGFNVNLDITPMRPQLKAIKDVGWKAFSSEGVSAKQVSILREYLPYINYGGENGEDVYANGSMYYRPRGMCDANYNECYHKGINYLAALKSANQSTPNAMGLTLMLYTTASLEMDTAAMIAAIQNYIANGVRIQTIHFWAGVNDCPTKGLDGVFNALFKALDSKFGFVIDGVVKPTGMSISADKMNIKVNDKVTFTGKLMTDNKPLAGKKVTIDDMAATTDANGQAVVSKSFTSAGTKTIYAKFAGDNEYMASTSNRMDITVQDAPIDEVGPVYTFARGSDSALWYRKLGNDAWGPWTPLGGTLTAPPWTAIGAKGNVYVFARGSDKAVWYRYVTPEGVWSAWASLGGNVQI